MNQSVHLKVCSYLHTGATFSHALSSLPLCLVSTSAFSLPSDPPPSLGERERATEGVPNTDTFLLQTRARTATELDSVYMSAHMWMSVQLGLDQDTLFILLALIPLFNCQEMLKHAI